MYQSFKNFLFRTPFFPFSALSDFEIKQYGAFFREMLQIATPDLSEVIDNDKTHTKNSIYRYYERACTRPTPFGLFAGCSMGALGKHTEIQLLKQNQYKRNTRLDMNYICALTQLIEKERNIREQLYYYPNSSMYYVGCHFRYVEYHYWKTRRVHRITQVENSEYLQKILSLAKGGARFLELTAILINDEISKEEASDFLHELIDAQVLVSELEPEVTNVQPLTRLIVKLKGLQNQNKQIIDILSEIETQVVNIDSQLIGSTSNIYSKIIKNIEKTNVETEIKYLFQTDMFKPVQYATVSRNIIKDIKQTLVFLNKITSPPSRTNLLQFKENFYKRYEEREMPMLSVLDNEIGIGYTGYSSGDISPLVDDLAVPHDYLPYNVSMSEFQSIFLKRYQQTLQKGEHIIELTDADVKNVEIVWNDLPLTFSVVCQILQDDDNGRSIFIQSTGGQSATNLLGRFCHLDDQILNHVLTITEKETQMNPDVIFAEIVHLPESRIGNILLRPILRPYEIPYLAKSGGSDEFELRPDDLYISIKNNRIVLRSNKLNKEIIPRMSTAHNFSGQNPMPVYHFLCDLQHQNGRAGLWFTWNEIVQHFDYLPRVVYRNCILSQARWTVSEKEIRTFNDIKDDSELLLKVKEWQNVRKIHDTFLLADGDNELYVNLKNSLSIRAWLSIVKKRPFFYLEEFLFNPKTAVVRGPEGVFTNEFIFAFYRESMEK